MLLVGEFDTRDSGTRPVIADYRRRQVLVSLIFFLNIDLVEHFLLDERLASIDSYGYFKVELLTLDVLLYH